jgi:hypothetical protein
LCSFLHPPVSSSLLDPNVPLNTQLLDTVSTVFFLGWQPRFHSHTNRQVKL